MPFSSGVGMLVAGLARITGLIITGARKLVFAFVLAVNVGVRYLGLWQGQHTAPQASSGQAQVAAVTVDPTARNKAADEVAGLAVAIPAATVSGRAHTASTDRFADKDRAADRRHRRSADGGHPIGSKPEVVIN